MEQTLNTPLYYNLKRSYSLHHMQVLRDELSYYNQSTMKLSPGLVRELDRKINRVAKRLFKELKVGTSYQQFKAKTKLSIFEKFAFLTELIEDEVTKISIELENTLDNKKGAKKIKKLVLSYAKNEYRLTSRNRYNKLLTLQGNLMGYTLVSPAIIIVSVFMLYAIGFAVYASLNVLKIKGAGLSWEFVGLDQYERVVNNSFFVESLKTTVIYMLMVAPIQTVIALILASVLSSKLKGSHWFMVIYFLPTLTSSTALTLIFVRLFGNGGPISSILGNNFTTQHILGLIAIMNIWSTVPMFMTTFNAALADVPKSLYEAAEVDGATPVRKFWLVTVPQLRPVISYVLLMGVIGTLQMFDQAFIIAKDKTIGANPSALVTTSKYIYDAAFTQIGQDWGYASAAAVIFTAIILLFSLIAYYTSRGGKRN